MAKQIIQQPNGKYCVYSIIVDDITIANATEEEIIEYYGEHAKSVAKEEAKQYLEILKSGENHIINLQ